MKRVFTVFSLMALLAAFSPASAQVKIAVVSADEVFAGMPEVAKADTALAMFQQALAEGYQDQQNELNDAYAKFVKDSSKMTPAVKEAKRKDLQDRITNLQNKEQELNKSLEVQKDKELKPIRDKMLKAIQDVARENGYGYVMYKEQLIVFPDADDITAKVKAKLKIK
jgi:outer membrane protein